MIYALAVRVKSIRSVMGNNMAIIKKKIWPEYFDAVASGKKKYELRLNDFEINEGDVLILEEWNPETKEYTGRKIEKKVTYVGKFKIDKLFWSEERIKEKGIQIISLE
jgi:ASC-1-like (ASCH) protein